MNGYFLKNKNGEFLKTINTQDSKLEFTNDINEAKNYINKPGGGRWDADNEKYFLDYHFKDEYKERVTSLECVYEEW